MNASATHLINFSENSDPAPLKNYQLSELSSFSIRALLYMAAVQGHDFC